MQVNKREIGDPTPKKGPQSVSDILIGETPKNAKRLICVQKMYLGDVRVWLQPGMFIDVVPGEHWRYDGQPFKHMASLSIAIRRGFVEPYNPNDQQHHDLIHTDRIMDGEREPTLREQEDLFGNAPTVSELESGNLRSGTEGGPPKGNRIPSKPLQPMQRMYREAGPGQHHINEVAKSENVRVGTDRLATGEVQDGSKLDPQEWQGEHSDNDGVDDEPGSVGSQEARPMIRGKDATASLRQHIASQTTHATLEEKRLTAERQRLASVGADANGNMPLTPGAEVQSVSKIVDSNRTDGLQNHRKTSNEKTPVITNGIDNHPQQVQSTNVQATFRQKRTYTKRVKQEGQTQVVSSIVDIPVGGNPGEM